MKGKISEKPMEIGMHGYEVIEKTTAQHLYRFLPMSIWGRMIGRQTPMPFAEKRECLLAIVIRADSVSSRSEPAVKSRYPPQYSGLGSTRSQRNIG